MPGPGDADGHAAGTGHPQPELIDFRDPARSRKALETLGAGVWKEALDWLYGEAMRRPTAPDRYPDIRRSYFG